jgi:kynurenine formamidase
MCNDCVIEPVKPRMLSQDRGRPVPFAARHTWIGGRLHATEDIANRDALTPAGGTLFAGVAKHRGGSGGQARVIAIV